MNRIFIFGICLAVATLVVVLVFVVLKQYSAPPAAGYSYVANVYNAEIADLLPEEPTPDKARRIHAWAAPIPGVGYEIWARFEFENESEFNEYKEAVLALPRVTQRSEDLTFNYPVPAPPEEVYFWDVDQITDGLMVVPKDTNIHWLFDLNRLRVYILQHD